MARLRRIATPGGRSFEYVSQGKGPATLLVHPGGPGLTYHYLRGLLKLANAHLRVVLFNPRGVGHSWSPRSPGEYTITAMAEDVEAIRKALHISELHLLGYSAGGFVALEYAHRYERRLTSLLLCATAGSAEEIRQSNRMALAVAAPSRRARVRELTRAKAFDSPEYQALVEQIFGPFQTRFFRGTSGDWKATKMSAPVYRAMMTRSGDEFAVDGTIAKWDGRKYYSKIEVPTLVVVGRYDFFLTPSVEMSDRIEPAHLRVLQRSSHRAILEQPKEFLGTIREFLEDVTGG
ncbi:MAG: alpha/beta fold hydrolase [Thermoplasmata archaeon]|jgi:proline iminopeptidase|nr:alpha/beta fold hydrolase [Thermoplasmata archaeon]